MKMKDKNMKMEDKNIKLWIIGIVVFVLAVYVGVLVGNSWFDKEVLGSGVDCGGGDYCSSFTTEGDCSYKSACKWDDVKKKCVRYCLDVDPFNLIYYAGSVIGPSESGNSVLSIKDECDAIGDELSQVYCEGGESGFAKYGPYEDCPNGCSDGACLPPDPCNEIENQGDCETTVGCAWDGAFCVEGEPCNVRCDECPVKSDCEGSTKPCQWNDKNTPEEEDDWCEDFKCTDTDPSTNTNVGGDEYFKGEVTGLDPFSKKKVTREDRCATSYFLIQYLCDKGYIYSTLKDCIELDSSCKDGVCVKN